MRTLLRPWRDLLDGMESMLAGRSALPRIFAGLLLGWWLYVPVHELLHVAGCVLAGGTVHRLEIDGVYGGALLERVFPFVHAGSEYAGRLSGFDTRGSDLVYLSTVLAPFIVLVAPGVALLHLAHRRRRPLLFGAALPFALSPFLSLTGDAYEAGSIILTWLPPFAVASRRSALVGDDVFRVAAQLDEPLLWLGLGLAFLIGLALCYLWYEAMSRLLAAKSFRADGLSEEAPAP